MDRKYLYDTFREFRILWKFVYLAVMIQQTQTAKLKFKDICETILFSKGSGQVGFVVDKVALGQVFSEYFDFPCQSLLHQLLHNHPRLSSGAGTIGQKWPQYKGLSATPLAILCLMLFRRK
jgi:hypothetical protein